MATLTQFKEINGEVILYLDGVEVRKSNSMTDLLLFAIVKTLMQNTPGQAPGQVRPMSSLLVPDNFKGRS